MLVKVYFKNLIVSDYKILAIMATLHAILGVKMAAADKGVVVPQNINIQVRLRTAYWTYFDKCDVIKLVILKKEQLGIFCV